jgi:sulfite reductase beta subunit-like hemoprotein
VTHSRGLGRLLGDFLRSRPDLTALAPELRLRASGCPNGCGRHHVADIGFQGSVRQLGGRPLPQYFVSVGGGLDESGARFGRLVAKVPARRVAEAVERLLDHAVRERQEGETTRAFLQRADLGELRSLLADLEAFDPAQAGEEDYVDPGGEESAVTPGAA